ncbi:Uncharacterised protein [Mycobacteroides abscessus subsp. abscessus]|nr:Uncharacterised protein [Mycobacteroides abscessus subsp. abscessus]
MSFDTDSDRGGVGVQEFVPCQTERDQQNVLYASMKRCGHLTEQLAGGIGVE